MDTSANDSNNNTKKRIMFVGCCVVDFITISKEFPIEDSDSRCLAGYWQRGGNASNNCTVIRKLGAPCEFLGMLSSSDAFRMLIDDIHRRDINIENCPKTLQDPPFSSVILSQSTGTRTIVHCNTNYPILTYEHFTKCDLTRYGWIHFEGQNVDETVKMMNDIREFNKKHSEKIVISLELEKRLPNNYALAKLANYISIGKDLALSEGWNTARETCFGLLEKLECRNSNGPIIISPWGAAGASFVDGSTKHYEELPAYTPGKIVDTLGAGDTFLAALIYALYFKQATVKDAVNFGNRAASFKIEHRGYDDVERLSYEI